MNGSYQITPKIIKKLEFLEKEYNLKGNLEEKLLNLIEFYTSNNNNNHFHDYEKKRNLPDSLTSLIVSFLPLKSLINFSLTSKKCWQIVKRQDLWHKICFKHFDDNYFKKINKTYPELSWLEKYKYCSPF
eukprot:TRINITY_DN11921_c0_g1_i1.p1 TRINITY_DN11921_c0_g1~~TRINITY_DN11921_c0_g1_i1.p1  ORF type:complete len:130 (+),score=34.24 TRINITY_DN11921_c0_g1_i1:73-462(+)